MVIFQTKGDRFFNALSVVGTISILGWLLKFCSYGFDFTDEGFYLVWLKNPFEYKWGYTQFGFVYHPLYVLFGGNISILRQVNILMTFGLAVLLVNQFFKTLLPENPLPKLQRWIFSTAFSLSSLVLFDNWLLTPSYNSLALQAIFLAATGLLMGQTGSKISRLKGWALVGVGGWLAFMAKPTTAVALGVSVLVYQISARDRNWRWPLVALGVSLCFLISTAFVIDGSVLTYIDRLKTSARLAREMGGGYTLGQILRLDRFHFKLSEILLMILVGGFSFLASWLSKLSGNREELISRLISAVFFISVPVVLFGGFSSRFGFGGFHNLTLWAVSLSAVALGFFSFGRSIFSLMPTKHKFLALLFVVLPHVYAFGSNNNYFQKGSSVSLFWILAGLFFIGPMIRNNKKGSILVPLALGTQLIVALVLRNAFEDPYRQEGRIALNDQRVAIGHPGSSLLLSKGYADYVKEVLVSAQSAGFVEGTPVIDLTGQSPGVLYAMGALSIGQPWNIGGYPGSFTLATEALRLVLCEKIAKAWVLDEPEGPRGISKTLLENFGGNLHEHFEPVATFNTPKGSGGYSWQRRQILMKPNRLEDVATQACLENTAGFR